MASFMSPDCLLYSPFRFGLFRKQTGLGTVPTMVVVSLRRIAGSMLGLL